MESAEAKAETAEEKHEEKERAKRDSLLGSSLFLLFPSPPHFPF